MKDRKVIPTGYKIKSLRDRYHLRQDEIVGTDITRNLISQIENGKAKLTRSTAEIIINHASKILQEKGMKLDIDIEYLMEDEEAQARIILDKFIAELRELSSNKDASFVDTLKETEKFLVEWDFIDKKIVICDLSGEYFFKTNDFYKASIYYENVKCLMNVNMDMIPLIPVLKKLSSSYFYMGKYKEGIDICVYALDRFPDMDKESKTVFLFNSSLYYNYLKEYEKAIEIIRELDDIVEESFKEKYIKILLLKASCLHHLKKYEEALKAYKKLLEMAPKDDYGNRALYFNNLTEIYIDIDNLQLAGKYLKEAIALIPNIPKDFEARPQFYLEIGRRYLQLKDNKNAFMYIKESLKLAKEFKYPSVINDVLMELVHVSQEEIDIKMEFMKVVQEFGSFNNLIMISLVQYYSALGDTKTIGELCEFCKGYL